MSSWSDLGAPVFTQTIHKHWSFKNPKGNQFQIHLYGVVPKAGKGGAKQQFCYTIYAEQGLSIQKQAVAPLSPTVQRTSVSGTGYTSLTSNKQ